MLRAVFVRAGLLVLLLVTMGSLCKKQSPPAAPAAPAGQASCEPNVAYSYRASTTDPDGDDINYRFDWGDSTMSVWSRHAPSGAEVSCMHLWGTAGTYSVKAQAKDAGGLETGWSASLVVTVATSSQNQAPGTPAVPSGSTSGTPDTSYSYSSSASDPDGDSVSLRFDWGDGDTSSWTALAASGASVSAVHSWNAVGSYAVKAQANDVTGRASAWSTPLVVSVVWTQNLPAPDVTYVATSGGNVLRLSWLPVAGAEGYRVESDDSTFTTSLTTCDLMTPSRAVAVSAYSGAVGGEKWTLVTTAVITLSLEVYGMSDPNPDHPAAFGFATDGLACPYSLSQPSQYPYIDYVMDDMAQGSMFFYSPNRYNPVFNDKDNAVAEASGSDFDAATMATGDFYTSLGCVPGVLYYFWLDPNANGWDATVDHFGKMKVISVAGTKVTMKLAYQMVPGLTWVRTN